MDELRDDVGLLLWAVVDELGDDVGLLLWVVVDELGDDVGRLLWAVGGQLWTVAVCCSDAHHLKNSARMSRVPQHELKGRRARALVQGFQI